MPHQSALGTRVLRTRRACTGESHQLAKENLKALKGHPQAIPSAATIAQQELEAHLLLALRDVSQMRDQGLPFYPFGHIIPKPHSLELTLLPHAIGSLAFGLVPRDLDDEIEGVAGLRVAPTRRGLSLRLLNTDGRLTDANILLRGTTLKQWSQALEWANDQYVDKKKRFHVHEHALTIPERKFLRQYRRLRAHPILASLILRRLNLLRDATWIDAWQSDSTIKIEWQEGPQLLEVGHLLLDPAVGLLDEGVDLREHERIKRHADLYSLRLKVPTPPENSIYTESNYPECTLLMRRTD